MLKNKQLKGVYTYNGFGSPKKIADDVRGLLNDLKAGDTTICSNYLGNLSSDLIEELELYLNEGWDVEDLLPEFSLFKDPAISEFIDLNIYRYGLEPLTYLDNL